MYILGEFRKKCKYHAFSKFLLRGFMCQLLCYSGTIGGINKGLFPRNIDLVGGLLK